MTSSYNGLRFDFDLKIERTLLIIRRSHRISENNTILTKQMANHNYRTLKELATLDVTYQPFDKEYPKVNEAFEIKFGLIHWLSTFHGFAGKDLHKHLKEFRMV